MTPSLAEKQAEMRERHDPAAQRLHDLRESDPRMRMVAPAENGPSEYEVSLYSEKIARFGLCPEHCRIFGEIFSRWRRNDTENLWGMLSNLPAEVVGRLRQEERKGW